MPVFFYLSHFALSRNKNLDWLVSFPHTSVPNVLHFPLLHSVFSSHFSALLLDRRDREGKLCILPAATLVNWVVNISKENHCRTGKDMARRQGNTKLEEEKNPSLGSAVHKHHSNHELLIRYFDSEFINISEDY